MRGIFEKSLRETSMIRNICEWLKVVECGVGARKILKQGKIEWEGGCCRFVQLFMYVLTIGAVKLIFGRSRN